MALTIVPNDIWMAVSIAARAHALQVDGHGVTDALGRGPVGRPCGGNPVLVSQCTADDAAIGPEVVQREIHCEGQPIGQTQRTHGLCLQFVGDAGIKGVVHRPLHGDEEKAVLSAK